MLSGHEIGQVDWRATPHSVRTSAIPLRHQHWFYRLCFTAYVMKIAALVILIEFFGYSGIDSNKVRAKLPFHEKDRFNVEAFGEKIESAREAVKQVIGQVP